MLTTKSPLMDELYGLELSNQIYANLEDLDPELNKEVQEIAYEHYWARPGLLIKDKSLITLASLIALGKEKQLRPHITGFLNTGGTKEELLNVIHSLHKYLEIRLVKAGINIVIEILAEQNQKITDTHEINYSLENCVENINIIHNRSFYLASIAASAAIGDNEKTQANIQRYLTYSDHKMDDVKNLLIHLIAYCGFPVAINGFNALKNACLKLRESCAPN